MTTYRFSVSLPFDTLEDALGILYAGGMCGCEQGESPSRAVIVAYFENDASANSARDALCGRSFVEADSVEPVLDQDWNAKWRETMKPVLVAPGIWVSPTWLAPAIAAGDRWIKIEPKMAFGTGHHETTRLAAQAIVTLAAGRSDVSRLLDIGTGSGVLCFVAALHSVGHCLGVEVDQDCLGNLAENLRDNPSKSRIDFLIGGAETIRVRSIFDVVVMNMIYTQSASLLGQVASMLKKGGHLVWSGILIDGRAEALSAAHSSGFSLVSESTEGEWWGGIFAGGRA